MKRMFAILLCLSLLIAAAACGTTATTAAPTTTKATTASTTAPASTAATTKEQEPINVALFIPRTGDLTQYGTYITNGVMLKVSQVNAAGGINGRKLVVDVFDDKGVPQESASVAQMIVDNKKYVAAIGSFNTPCVLAAATVFDEAKMVEMVPCAGADTVHTQRKYTFRQQNTNTTEFTFLGKVAVNDLKAQKVAVIYIQNDSGIISKNVVSKTVTDLGKQCVATEGIMPDQVNDYTAMLNKIKNAGADTCVTTCNAADLATIIKQSKQLGMDKMVWLSTGTVYTDEFLEVGGEAVNGVYALTTYFSGNPDPRISAWTKAYLAAYNNSTPNYFATGAYECTAMLCAGFAKGNLDRVSIYNYLLTIRDWDGETGKSTYDETRNVMKNMTILQIVNRKFQMANLSEFKPNK